MSFYREEEIITLSFCEICKKYVKRIELRSVEWYEVCMKCFKGYNDEDYSIYEID